MIDFSALNYIDYTVFAIVFLSTLFAFYRGFVVSFLSLMGWVLSIYLTYLLFPDIKPLIEEKIKSPLIVLIAGHTVLLLIFLILFGIFNLFATTAVAPFSRGVIDRSLGAAFGITRGAIIVSFLFFIFSAGFAVFHGSTDDAKTDDDALPSWLKDAQTYRFMKVGKNILAEFIPDSFYNRVETAYADISKKSLDERFIENATQKLRKQLPAEIQQQLDSTNEESALTMSEDQLETKKAKDTLKAYQDILHSTDSNGNPTISEEELKRLQQIINKREVKLTPNNPTLDVNNPAPPADSSPVPDNGSTPAPEAGN